MTIAVMMLLTAKRERGRRSPDLEVHLPNMDASIITRERVGLHAHAEEI